MENTGAGWHSLAPENPPRKAYRTHNEPGSFVPTTSVHLPPTRGWGHGCCYLLEAGRIHLATIVRHALVLRRRVIVVVGREESIRALHDPRTGCVPSNAVEVLFENPLASIRQARTAPSKSSAP